MASKLSPLLFLFSLLILQTTARDVQFFSKVSPSAVTTAGATPVKSENNFNNPKQDQDPTFIPESQNAYGLYGNQEPTETQFPTTTKLAADTTFTPTQTRTRETFSNYPNSNPNYSNEQFSENAFGEQNNNFENQETTATQFPTTTKLAGDATFTQTQTRTREPNYPNYSNEQINDNAYGERNNNFEESNYRAENSDSKYNYYSNNGGNWNKNGERQGMSDTRFMENGKYYYDVQNENNNNYFPNDRYQQNPRGNYNNENNFEFENSSVENDFPENERYVP